MKTIYPRNLRHKHRAVSAALLGVLIVFAVVILNLFAPRFLTPAFERVGAPFWRARNEVSEVVHSLRAYIRSKSTLEKERDRLRMVIEELSLGRMNDSATVHEHENLLRELGRNDAAEFIHAYILRKPSVAPFDSLIIDAGRIVGVAPGMRVRAGAATIGEVREAGSTISTVELYSSPSRETSLELGMTGIRVTAIGRGGGNFEIRMPRDIPVSEGALLELPGKRGLVAEVAEVRVDETSAEQLLIARALANVEMRTWLLIDRVIKNDSDD